MPDQIQAIRKFNRFYTNFLGLLNERLLDSPITLTEGRVLFEIDGQIDCTAKGLINSLCLDRGYLSRDLKRLERIGLITRTASAQDKRVRNLSLTNDGKLILRRIDRSASHQIRTILGGLNGEERKQLVLSMRDIETILSNLSIG